MPGEGRYKETWHCLSSDVSLLNPNDGSPAQTLSAVLFHVSKFVNHNTVIQLGQGDVCTLVPGVCAASRSKIYVQVLVLTALRNENMF